LVLRDAGAEDPSLRRSASDCGNLPQRSSRWR